MQATRFVLKRLSLISLIIFGVCCLPSEAKQPHKKVLILGAGLSGIVAGKTLQQNGVDDFLLLEGQDYIGGRIKQVPFGGLKVEDGANFIHSFQAPETKPLWQQKVLQSVSGVIRSETVTVRNESGSVITDRTDLYKLIQVMMKIKEAQNENEEMNKLSARKGLEKLGWNPNTPLQYAYEWWLLDYSYANKAENLAFSALEFDTTSEDFLVGDQRGMMQLYREFFKGFKDKIKLNSTVTDIKYDSSSVEVKLSNGEVYTADYVLCTFSTGVLSSNMVTFTPPLPSWKTKAFSEKPLSSFTKIFIKFPKRFWEDKDDILMVNSKRGYYPVILNLDTQGLLQGSGIMLMILTGDESRRIEKQSLNDTKQEIVKLLKGIYGGNFTEPTDIYHSQWNKNPYVRGAYSEGTVGFSASQNHKDMMKNHGKLYFSGEATSEEWYGYMQGAYLTGEKQAQTIAKAIKCDEDKKNCPVNKGARVESTGIAFVLAVVVVQLYQEWCVCHW